MPLVLLAAEAVAGGAVVLAPDRLGRREGAGQEALVGVDVGREEIGDLAGMRQQAGHIVLHQRRHAVFGLLVEEQRRLAVGAPQRLVDMRRAAGGTYSATWP